jgi:hypothetical protein
MPTPRTRVETWNIQTGSRTLYGSTDYRESEGFSNVCDDVEDGFGLENPFFLTKDYYSGGFLNGSITNKTFSNWPTPLQTPGYYLLPSVPSHTERATLVASLSNPSRPTISIPTFIGELKDFPRMIRHAGRYLLGTAWKHKSGLSFAKELASQQLAIQFGWAPLVGDLEKAVKFTESYERRVNELNRLYSGRGLRRRVKLDTVTATGSINLNAHSAGGVLFTNIPNTQETTVENWGVIRWQPSSLVPKPQSPEEVRNLMLGLHPAEIISTAWELLPWSWLIDYFSNVGRFLSLTNNQLLAEVNRGSLMRHYICKRSWGNWHITNSSGSIRLDAGETVREFKIRSPFTSADFGITASFPLLSGKQVSILSSLAILRK